MDIKLALLATSTSGTAIKPCAAMTTFSDQSISGFLHANTFIRSERSVTIPPWSQNSAFSDDFNFANVSAMKSILSAWLESQGGTLADDRGLFSVRAGNA